MKQKNFNEKQILVNRAMYEYIDEIDKHHESRFYFIGVLIVIIFVWLMWLTFGL